MGFRGVNFSRTCFHDVDLDVVAACITDAATTYATSGSFASGVGPCSVGVGVDNEIERLEKELHQLQKEEDLLRKTLEIERISTEKKVKKEQMKNVRGIFAI